MSKNFLSKPLQYFVTKNTSTKTKYSSKPGSWTHFIRFLDPDGQVQWGEPVEGSNFKHARLIINGIVSQTVVNVTAVFSPVANPTNIICVGLNYNDHIKEIGKDVPKYPVIFHKNVSSINSHTGSILIPKQARGKVDFEAELAVVIGHKCKNVKKDEALSYVLGYTCANDVTARFWQDPSKCGHQFSYSKSFDTFCPLGPAMVSPSVISDPGNLDITCTVNGEVFQKSNTKEMIFDIPHLIEFLSIDTTLSAGTVILTGTPGGVGYSRTPPYYLSNGDEVSVEIEKIGQLTNYVFDE